MSLIPVTQYGNQFTSAEVTFLQGIADHSYLNGELAIGKTSTHGVNITTLTAGSGITITNGSGTITIAATGSSFAGSQEKSTTSPNGVQTTFAFTHTPELIFWNGAFQTLTDDYTVSSLNITFTASAGVPLTNDKIVNVYA
jgi:hypothetical protein